MKKFIVSFMLFFAFLGYLKSQSNQYLHFDRVDDWVKVPNGASYVLNSTQGLSMAGWFYSDDLSYGQGMMGFRGGSTEFYLIQIGDGKLESRYISSTGFYEVVGPANTIIPQVWQHLAWVFDGTSVKLYVNGFLVGSKAASGVLTDATVPFAIGKSPVGTYNFVFGGRADEVSVWTKGLTQAEIQNMMQNELTGTEAGLQMYYKFNQGIPGGNNTSITKLISQLNSPERDGDLLNFALTGETSNFNGELDTTFQAISFPPIGNKLISTPPFTLQATSSSGLPVQYQVLSGPASVNGNLVTLTGATGQVLIEASQPGNAQYTPADPVVNSFMVLDPNTTLPYIEARNPIEGDVYVPELNKIQLAAISTIDYTDLFFVANVKFVIDGQTIPGQNFFNGHYTAWWTPPSYGNYNLQIVSTNNYGASSTKNVSIKIVEQANTMNVTAFEGIWIATNNPSELAEAELPCYQGAFDKITATLKVTCPTGGCGEWDRIASVDVKGHDGKWFEIIRYITPYGVACSHSIDLTDYMSLLQGKVTFRMNCATFDNGYVYQLDLNYRKGTPAHPYSNVAVVWGADYNFGDMANLQPVEGAHYVFPDGTVASKLKLVSTGHGWGNTNTGNAAEFYNATHSIWVNGTKTFNQLNWTTCNPNPDACMPQNGTWYYDRAGWCPGSIAKWFDFDLTPYVAGDEIDLGYKFYESYVDLCHPNNPNCVTGVTCSNCDEGFNPYLDVACNLVSFADNPIVILGEKLVTGSGFSVNPNPTTGLTEVYFANPPKAKINGLLTVYNLTGSIIHQQVWDGEKLVIDLTGQPRGMYMVQLQNAGKTHTKKLIVN